MSSFFTLPLSQRKRKRAEGAAGATKKRTNSAPSGRAQKPIQKKRSRSESISGSESDEEGGEEHGDEVSQAGSDVSSNHEDETGAERRLRLAERYLENIREEVDEAGFDAADIDRDLIAERLQEDVAEGKGKVYRFIADEMDYTRATSSFFRTDQLAVTGIAACSPFAYTVSKDMILTKWELADPAWAKDDQTDSSNPQQTNITPRRKPRRIRYYRGNKNRASDSTYLGHTSDILCVAVSNSGKFVATGGADNRLVVWDADTLKPLKVFDQHRGAVTAVSFRRNTHQLFSASTDRTIKSWSLDELAYVETLFGHQESILDVKALSEETCVSVGGRDCTARLWKVAEETQLVFRGGGVSKSRMKTYLSKINESNPDGATNENIPSHTAEEVTLLMEDPPAEGSIDRIALISSTHFLTGSDNGSLSLWAVHKKKPLMTLPLAHGCSPPPVHRDEGPRKELKPLPRWITALATVPYSDLAVSASWDGTIRVWRVDERSIEPLGIIGRPEPSPTTSVSQQIPQLQGGVDVEIHDQADAGKTPKLVKGVVNDLAVFERGDRGKHGLCVIAAVGKEHRLGRWLNAKQAKNGAVVFEIPRKMLTTEDMVNGNDN